MSVARLKKTTVIRSALLQQRRLSIVVGVRVRRWRAVHLAVSHLVQLSSLRVACPWALHSAVHASARRRSRMSPQETTGDLHYHFIMFVQRLHQFATLQEIAQKGDKIETEADCRVQLRYAV